MTSSIRKRSRFVSDTQRTALALYGLEVSPEEYYIWRDDKPSPLFHIVASYDFDYWNIRDPNYMFILGILNGAN
jgi:hypothetical protein